MSRLLVAVLTLTVFACSKAKAPDATAGSGSAVTPAVVADATAAGSAAVSVDAAIAAGSGSDSVAAGSAAPAAEDDGFHFVVKTPLENNSFDKLERDMKMKFMKEFVAPQMKEQFQAFDAKKFASFGCKTCHGKALKERKYKMPNPELPKLDFKKLEAGKQEPKMAKFMGLHTSPDMAKILNLTPYDDKHPDGFGCLHCHEAAK